MADSKRNPPDGLARSRVVRWKWDKIADKIDEMMKQGRTFTKLFVDALSGAAANLQGKCKNFVSLRKVQPPISLTDLRKIQKNLLCCKNIIESI